MSADGGARGIIFKYRGLLWGIFALGVLALPVSFSAVRAFAAVPLLLGGQLLRFWAAGVIPKYRTLTVDAPRLVTWGPYAIVRNPLYAGNALLGLGWALMAGWLWVAAFAAVYFLLYSVIIIPYEESFLIGKFRDEYIAYKSVTPSLIPAISGARGKAADRLAGFDPASSWLMERHSLFMNMIVTALVCLRLLVLDY
jgi:protein-S-isoprenylcysteine O-methyltransferase Ste14